MKLNSLNLGQYKTENNAVNAPASLRTKNIPAKGQAVWRKRGSNRLKIQFCFLLTLTQRSRHKTNDLLY
jgi:hypothetical protein